MRGFTKTDETEEITESERARLADELAELKGQVKALRAERDETRGLNQLKAEIEELKLSKARLVEENDRKIRETEHKVGLLKLAQDHEVKNAKRETQLEVREHNLKADKDRFADEMEFQRKHLQGEVTRIESILTKVLDRLPNIEATFSAETTVPARKAPAKATAR